MTNFADKANPSSVSENLRLIFCFLLPLDFSTSFCQTKSEFLKILLPSILNRVAIEMSVLLVIVCVRERVLLSATALTLNPKRLFSLSKKQSPSPLWSSFPVRIVMDLFLTFSIVPRYSPIDFGE